MNDLSSPDDVIMRDVALRLGTHDFHFDCRLPNGRITAITGASGSGKSTFLNLLSGFERPASGRIMLMGKDVTERHPSQRPVSLVFQDNNLFAHLDVFTNVGLGIHPAMKLSPHDRDAVSIALERVGLVGLEKRMPGTLSGGERQRAAFARALVRQKPILLLDEPFAALDPGLRAEMAELLCKLHRETKNTVAIVSHDPAEVRRIADYAIFIEHGIVKVSEPLNAFLSNDDVPALRVFLGH